MRATYLIARKGERDRYGNVWWTEGLAEKLREKIGDVVTIDFRKDQVAGRLVEIEETETAIYGVVEISNDALFAERISSLSIGTMLSRERDEELDSLRDGEIVELSAMSPANSPWHFPQTGEPIWRDQS